MDGVRSSMSYVGAKDILDYQSKCEFVSVTSNGVSEAKPHLLTKWQTKYFGMIIELYTVEGLSFRSSEEDLIS